MARTDNLTNFLTDVASAIKTKKGDETPIPASDFDTEIENLPSGGGSENKVAPSLIQFRNNKNTTIDLSNIDTSNVTSMSWMFANCEELISLDVSKFNTSEVTSFSNMFYYCSKLTNIDMSSFDTSKATDMSSMFAACFKVTNLDVSKFNTSKVTRLNGMFSSCWSLISLDLSNFDTSNTAYVDNMFAHCKMLTSLDLRNFNSNKFQDINYMFDDCVKLEEVYLFDTSNLRYGASNLFRDCSSLHTVHGVVDVKNGSNLYEFVKNCSKLENIQIKNLKSDLDIHWSPLSADSVNYLLNNVQTVSGKTITLGATNLAKASEEAKANATSKGWTLK